MRTAIAGKEDYQKLTVHDISVYAGSAEALAAAAKDSLAVRYALEELNPFVVLGVDYSQHNQNGELDLYDANTAPNGMSEQYLTDRASFLVAAVQAEVENATISADKIYYLDAASGLELQPFELVQKYDNTGLPYWEELPVAGAPRYIFGSNNGDTYDGRFYNVVQHVYGGAGDDSIKTGGGADADFLSCGSFGICGIQGSLRLENLR